MTRATIDGRWESQERPGRMAGMKEVIGWALISFAALIAAMNFYLSFLRFHVHRFMGWEYRWVSGAPLLGSIALLVAYLFLPQPLTLWLAVPLSVIDTGGILWLLLTVFLMTFVWKKPDDGSAEQIRD
jgi:hypothetical protein